MFKACFKGDKLKSTIMPKPTITPPEMRWTQAKNPWPMLSRNSVNPANSATHHNPEPMKTPVINNSAAI